MKRIGMLTSGGDCQALNAATVSYTHLDVYKRQRQQSTRAIRHLYYRGAGFCRVNIRSPGWRAAHMHS